MLLAMNLKFTRGRAIGQTLRLLELCGVQSIERAEAIFEEYYPGEHMKDRGYDQLKRRFTAPG
jgi:hypothetical protein